MTFNRGTRKKRVPLYSVSSLAALSTFAQHLDAYSTSSLDRISVTEVEEFTPVAAADTPYVGMYAVMLIKTTGTPADETISRQIHIPDPVAAMFELKKGIPVVKASYGDQVAAWYSTASGVAFAFDKGWLWQG